MRVRRDQLLERAVREDEAEAELVRVQRARRQLDLRAARLLARIESSAHFVFRGCSSIAQFGERLGLAGREARLLARVGRALELEEGLEARLLDGRVSLDAAACLARAHATPGVRRPGDRWLEWAERWPVRELERLVAQREVEVRSGQPASGMYVVLSASGRLKFERARLVASRKQGRPLAEGETIEVLSDHYLESFDPERRKARRRRMASTEGRPGRHVPAAVARRLRARHGDRCAVPGCGNRIWLEKAHLKPHREGGSREAHNLICLCPRHHRALDAGLMRFEGTAERPVFRDADGRVVGEQSARGPP